MRTDFLNKIIILLVLIFMAGCHNLSKNDPKKEKTQSGSAPHTRNPDKDFQNKEKENGKQRDHRDNSLDKWNSFIFEDEGLI